MLVTVAEVVPTEAAVSQIWAAIRRLNTKRSDAFVYVDCQMLDILRGILDEITPVLEPFTRGMTRATLDVLVAQGKIVLEKHPTRDLYTLKVCSAS